MQRARRRRKKRMIRIVTTLGFLVAAVFGGIFPAGRVRAGAEPDKDLSKAGKNMEPKRFYQVAEELTEQGAEVILLGCTELSVIGQRIPLEPGILDAMRVLAKRAVELCGVLKPQWRRLITMDPERDRSP